MKLTKIFTSDECPKCPRAKELGGLLTKQRFVVQLHDIGTANGLAEAAFHGVFTTPSILVVNESEDVIQGWRGVLPAESEVIRALRSA
jgi:glutaredoxin